MTAPREPSAPQPGYAAASTDSNTPRPFALVTGASRGIGRAIALELAARGFDIALNYLRDEAAATSAGEAIEALGRRALIVRADVVSAPEVAALFHDLDDRGASPSVVVCNAGIARDTLLGASEPLDFEAVLAVNLAGVVNVCREASRRMV